MTSETTTLETLKAWAKANTHFPVFTCYDATTARWLTRGGAKVLLVGDSAGRVILGLGDDDRPSVEFMTEIGAAVGRGAPGAFVIVDYPNDLADSSLDHGRRIRKLLHDSAASAIKVEGNAQELTALLINPAVQSVPVVAHLRQQPANHRCCCTSDTDSAVIDRNVETVAADVLTLAQAGAAAILLEGLSPEVTAGATRALRDAYDDLPILGCGAGQSCHGQVVMLHRLLGLGQSSPATGPHFGQTIADLARRQIDELASEPED